MAKTGADPDRRESFDFYQLLRAVESRIIATENAERMAVLPEDPLNVQLIQELRQQRNELDCRRKGRLQDPGVHGGAPAQQQSPVDQEREEIVSQLKSLRLSKTEPAVATRSMPFLDQVRMDPKKLTTPLSQAAVQSPAQGYSSAPGYEDWQSSTRPPQDPQYPQDSRYPQDSTAFGRLQQDARGQQGTRGQGWRTCFGCGGRHRFTEYECQGLKDLIQQGFVHLSDQGRLVARTHE